MSEKALSAEKALSGGGVSVQREAAELRETADKTEGQSDRASVADEALRGIAMAGIRYAVEQQHQDPGVVCSFMEKLKRSGIITDEDVAEIVGLLRRAPAPDRKEEVLTMLRETNPFNAAMSAVSYALQGKLTSEDTKEIYAAVSKACGGGSTGDAAAER